MSAVRISSTEIRLWNVTEKMWIVWIEDENQRHVFFFFFFLLLLLLYRRVKTLSLI